MIIHNQTDKNGITKKIHKNLLISRQDNENKNIYIFNG